MRGVRCPILVNLKALRLAKINPETGAPYTQIQMALLLGIQPGTYRNYEQGYGVSEENFNKLSAYFDDLEIR